MKLSAKTAKLLNSCLMKKGKGTKQVRWLLELVRCQAGTLAATDGQSAVIISGIDPLPDEGLYTLLGQELIYRCPIVETITGEETGRTGRTYQQGNWPESLDFLGRDRPVTNYPVVPGGLPWKVAVLATLIEHGIYLNMFCFLHILNACEAADPNLNPGGLGEGLLAFYGKEYPVCLSFTCDENAKHSGTNYKRAVSVWLMPFKAGIRR